MATLAATNFFVDTLARALFGEDSAMIRWEVPVFRELG